MKIKLFVTLIVGLVMVTDPVCAKKKLNNTFYVQNTMDGFKNGPKTALDKAKLLKTLGYNGLEGFGYKGFFELKNALDKEGLGMPANYVALNFEADGKLENTSANEIEAMIKASAKGSVIYFHLHSNSYKDDKETGDKMVASILRDLSDYSSTFCVKLCTYPHISFYCETLAHSVKLAKLVDRKNFGAAMNLCHLLKVEGSADIAGKVKEYAPWLFAVNICGADDGDTKQLGWNNLIQPLGQGSFDTYQVVKLLIDNGYSGPIGIQCYNLKGDAIETLTRSMETWKEYKRRYINEK
ncbi:MAG TPA: hypothetical protein DCR40_15125 [Prolixibacteraceae bacterium]|nr:hypothetical protein [Prolixibacteraceae bacterium]